MRISDAANVKCLHNDDNSKRWKTLSTCDDLQEKLSTVSFSIDATDTVRAAGSFRVWTVRP